MVVVKKLLRDLSELKIKVTALWDKAEQIGSDEMQEEALKLIDMVDDLIDEVQ